MTHTVDALSRGHRAPPPREPKAHFSTATVRILTVELHVDVFICSDGVASSGNKR